MLHTGRKLKFILCHILFTSHIKLFVTQLINNKVSHSMVLWHLFLEQQFFIWPFGFVNEIVSLLTWLQTWQVLQYILVQKGFPSNKTAVFRDSVNWTHVVYWPKEHSVYFLPNLTHKSLKHNYKLFLSHTFQIHLFSCRHNFIWNFVFSNCNSIIT